MCVLLRHFCCGAFLRQSLLPRLRQSLLAKIMEYLIMLIGSHLTALIAVFYEHGYVGILLYHAKPVPFAFTGRQLNHVLNHVDKCIGWLCPGCEVRATCNAAQVFRCPWAPLG
jgi:hypothetical protein